MWRHYVYIHRKASDGSPFYVGKGSLRARQKSQGCERALTHDSRNRAWRNVVAKHGLVVEVVASCADDAIAQSLERKLIAELGRRNAGSGPLINLTDGGDGHAGIIVSDDLRRKRSANAKGPRSDAWVQSIRRARKNGGNGGVVKRGDKLPENWRSSLATGKLGEKNPYFGKPTPVSKKVINTVTGAVYDSIARAAEAEGVNAKTLYQYLDGARPNRTPLARL